MEVHRIPPPPPPANPWMAGSKRQWLWLADKYEERLRCYWGDHGETERNAELQQELANEKAKRRKVEEKLRRYEVVHRRWFKFLMKELTLPPAPAVEPEKNNGAIIVLDDSAGALDTTPGSRTKAEATQQPNTKEHVK